MQVSKNVLRNVLGSDSTRYEIPLYQRTFDWNKVQFQKLWDDVISLASERQTDKSGEHFLGTLVLDSGHNIPNDFTFLVVDGQQRLTTLTMLLAALRDVLSESRPETTDADELQDGVLVHRYKKTYPERVRLWPTQGDRDAFIEILEGEVDPHNASNLTAAYKFFKTELNRLVVGGSGVTIDDVRSAVLDGLRFVTITAENGDNVYSIFESLNNTGLKLTQGDLLRNYFFSRLGDYAEATHTSFWFPMQERLSRDDLAHLFWLDLTMFDTEAKKDDTFKKQVHRVKTFDADALRDEVKRFNQLSVLLEVMRNPKIENDPSVRRALQRLVDFGIESVDPLILGLLDLRQKKILSNAQTAKALSILESFLVRRLIVRAPHNALSRILMRAYGAIHDSADPVTALLEYFSKDNKDFATDEDIRKAVVSVNFYRSGTNRQRKTLLSWMEEALAGNEPAGLDKATIEHVLPQTMSADWKEHLNRDLGEFASAEALHESLVHTLANLTLSGYNSSLSNKTFEVKRELLVAKSNIELNAWIASKEKWGRSELFDRGAYLSDLISRIWCPPSNQEPVLHSHIDPIRIRETISQIPRGSWASYGDVAEAAQVTVGELKHVLKTSQIHAAWRVMDADGRYESVVHQTSAKADSDKSMLEDDGVQFDASGIAMATHRWKFEGESSSSALDTLIAPIAASGPVREFLDSSANRLAPPVNKALSKFVARWIANDGTILFGVEQDDEETLTAHFVSEASRSEPNVLLKLTLSNGLLARKDDLHNFELVDEHFIENLAVRELSPLA